MTQNCGNERKPQRRLLNSAFAGHALSTSASVHLAARLFLLPVSSAPRSHSVHATRRDANGPAQAFLELLVSVF